MVIKFDYLLYFLLLITLSGCSGNLLQTVLLEEDFDELPPGNVIYGPFQDNELNYYEGTGKVGDWSVSTYANEDFSLAWKIVGNGHDRFLKQSYWNIDSEKEPLFRHIHPLIVAGDSIWNDYKVEFEFSPLELTDKCGLVFKYKHDRCYYFYGMEGGKIILKLVQQATAPKRPFEKILASEDFNWEKGKVYKGEVSIRENQIYTLFNDNDSLNLLAKDATISKGKIGFLSDVPAEFYRIKVTALKRQLRKINRYKRELSSDLEMRINENPSPVLWKKLATPGFGTGNNIRLGDLNGDGELDILIGQIEYSAKNTGEAEIICLTAITLNGELLWQKGTPKKERYHVRGNIGLQVHDLDGDGDKEVIYLKDRYVHIVNGNDGELLERLLIKGGEQGDPEAKTYETFIYFCDLQGKGRDGNMLISNGDGTVYAFDEHLKLLWNQEISQGSFPFTLNIDEDIFDEVAIGYSIVDNDGELICNYSDYSGDRNYGVAYANILGENSASLYLLYPAGEWGLLIMDKKGSILQHHPIGDIRHLSVGNFDNEKPGLELICSNSAGSRGIINLISSSGNIYHTFEPGQSESKCLPVNWKGDGEEYFLLNTSSGAGGLFNGSGELAVTFPDDGHPDMCCMVRDITGDARDEIITWNQDEIWIYTQKDNSRSGKIYQPMRNELYNFSNYQVVLSLPAWSQ